MRIGISARGLNILSGGAKEYIKNLIIHLLKIDKKNEYYIFYNDKNLLGTFKAINSVEVYIPKVSNIFWDHLLLPYYLEKNKIDVALFPKDVIPIIKVCKYIVTELDLGYFFPGLNAYKYWDTKYMRLMIPRSVRKADAICAISQNTRNDILNLFRGVDPEKIFITSLSSAYEGTVLDKDVKSKILKKYKLDNKKYIFFAGSLSPRKNVQRILKALARIKSQVPFSFVVTGGKSWNDSDIFHLIRELKIEDRIIKLGFVSEEDIPYLYSGAELFIYVSLFEGFGMPILEAFAFNCPVITSNTTSMPEVAGNAALLVDPYNIDEIADAIKLLSTSSEVREDYIRRGKLQLRNFSWENCAKDTHEAIKFVIENN